MRPRAAYLRARSSVAALLPSSPCPCTSSTPGQPPDGVAPSGRQTLASWRTPSLVRIQTGSSRIAHHVDRARPSDVAVLEEHAHADGRVVLRSRGLGGPVEGEGC